MRAWSKAAEAKLRKLYGREKLPRIAFLLKRTVKAVRSRAKVLNIKIGRRRPWTKADLRVLRRRFPHERTDRLARDLGRSLTTVYQKAYKIGLAKTVKYLASPDACRLRRDDNPGIRYRFPKGHVPANKGLRRPGWYAGRMRETQFKKGRPAHEARNYLPIGTERINADGYRERKVTDDPKLVPARRWIGVHRLIWEQAHGPIPPKHIVAFKDGNRRNVVLENFELITLAENARRNRMWNKYPKELAQVLQLRGAIKRQIGRREGRREEKDRGRRNAERRAVRNAKRLAQQGKPHGYRAGEGGGAGR